MGIGKIVEQSWATNGERGFFIDASGPQGSAMSLYDTAWWSQALANRRLPLARLSARSVAKWVLPILYGRPSSSAIGDIAGMPRLELLDDAIVISANLKIKIAKAIVGRRLGALRVGDMYKSNASSKAGDWGSTALAVSLFNKVGIVPPRSVTAYIVAHIPNAIAMRQVSNLANYILPLLSLMDSNQIRAFGPELRAQLAWIGTQLSSMNVMARLAVATELANVVRQSGAEPWPEATICAGLAPYESADSQVAADAVKLGCAGRLKVPPWTAAGWPNVETLTGAVQASVAGIRIADDVGIGARFRPQLRAELSTAWLADPPGSQGQVAGIVMLSRILGVNLPALSLRGTLSADLAAGPTAQSLPVLLIAWMYGIRGGRAIIGRVRSGQENNILVAAADDIAYRITGNHWLLSMSHAVLARIAVGSDLYGAVRVGDALPRPSVVATAVADWILGRSMPITALQRAELCNMQLSCGEAADNSPIDSPLRSTAAVAALQHPDAVSFPLAL